MKVDIEEEEDAEAAAEAEDSAEEDEDSRFFRRFPTFPFLFLLSVLYHHSRVLKAPNTCLRVLEVSW